MFNWISQLFAKNTMPARMPVFTGAIIDHSEPEIRFDDIVASAAVVDWANKKSYRSFPSLDQRRSMTCGAFTGRKHLGITYAQKYGNYIDFSEEDIYQRRANKGTPGMSFPDLFLILGAGVTLKALTNVTINTDADADNCVIEPWKREVGKQFAISKGIYIPAGQFETIASVIQTTGKSVMAIMFFTEAEWSSHYPQVLNPNLRYDSPEALHHFVNFVDFVTINGTRYLKVEDSAHFGGLDERFVTADFLKARNAPVPMANGYAMTFKFQISDSSLVHFDGSIISLQKCLQTLGMFPTNVSYFEGVGPTTRDALSKFQAAYGLTVSGAFDDQTRGAITRLFS